MKTTIKILLFIAIGVLTYLCFMSILTPIKFERVRAEREKNVKETLVILRTAQIEHREQKGYYTGSLDSLVMFIKSGKKKMVLKEGVLNEAQLLAGLTESKATAIVRRGNTREIIENGLEGFRRDTTTIPLLKALYNNELSENELEKIKYIPFSENVEFEMELNNSYVSSNGVSIPLCEIRAPYNTFLSDINRQETLNLIDLLEKLDRYPGLKVGALNEPNNFASNWE